MVSEIRITDQHILKIVQAEQQKTGEKTSTRTAQRLIIERLALREAQQRPIMMVDPQPAAEPSTPKISPSLACLTY